MKPASSPLFQFIPLAIALLLFAAAQLALPSAPERLPIHWNILGRPDGWASKAVALRVMPALALLMDVMFLALLKMKAGRALAQAEGSYLLLRLLFSAFCVGLQAIVFWAAFKDPAQASQGFSWLLSLLFVGIGALMPNFPRNLLVGIRLPWTLDSQLSWEKTQKLGGALFMASGIASALAVRGGTAWSLGVLLAGLAVTTVVCAVYSYKVFKSDPHAAPFEA